MANKRLGQHFLQNGGKLQKIANSLGLKKGDIVVEIGPGRGELTEKLIAAGARVIGIEKDISLAAKLATKYENHTKIRKENLQIICGDIRQELPILSEKMKGQRYLVAGNIPYYLTGYLFRMLGEMEYKPVRAVFTIQKEVAERICKTDEVGMNILAASIMWWADARWITSVPRKMFSPSPKVDSGAILLTTKTSVIVRNKVVRQPQKEYAEFMQFIKTLFSHPRKIAISNLSSVYSKQRILEVFNKLKINPKTRPERLSFKEIIILFQMSPFKNDRP